VKPLHSPDDLIPRLILDEKTISREREREEKESGEVVRDTTFRRQETISSVLKVPRQCSLVLLVEVMHVIGINIFMTLGNTIPTVQQFEYLGSRVQGNGSSDLEIKKKGLAKQEELLARGIHFME
jgi:hypothetical protein